MTIEELQAQLDDAKRANEGLKATNDALKKEKQTLQTEKDDAARKAEQASSDAASKNGDVETVRQQMQAKYDRDLAAVQKQLADQGIELNSIKVDNALQAATKDVRPELRDIYIKGLRADCSVDEGGNVMIGDVTAEKHVTSHLKSKEGLYLVAAAVNTGANGTKGGSGEAQSTWTREKFESDKMGFRDWAKQEGNSAEANKLFKSFTGTHTDVF